MSPEKDCGKKSKLTVEKKAKNTNQEQSSSFKLLKTIKGHMSTITCSTLDRTHSYLITVFYLWFLILLFNYEINLKYNFKGSKDRIVKIWSLASGFLVASFRGMDNIRAIDVNYENTILAVAADRDIYLYNLINGELLDNLSYPDHHHRKSIGSLKVSFCFLRYFFIININ